MVVCIPQTLTSLKAIPRNDSGKAEDRANLESINNIYVMNNWTVR
jgi:hypothetical protein